MAIEAPGREFLDWADSELTRMDFELLAAGLREPRPGELEEAAAAAPSSTAPSYFTHGEAVQQQRVEAVRDAPTASYPQIRVAADGARRAVEAQPRRSRFQDTHPGFGDVWDSIGKQPTRAWERGFEPGKRRMPKGAVDD